MPYRRDDFKADITMAMIGAGVVSLMAVPPLALLGLLNLVQQWRGDQLVPWLVYLLVLVMVASGYLMAALSSGTVFFLLRPLRKHWLGWVLTGSGSAICVYGSVLLAILVMWNPAGMWVMNIGQRHPSSEPLPLMFILPFLAGVFGPVGAVVGLYMYFTDDESPHRRGARR